MDVALAPMLSGVIAADGKSQGDCCVLPMINYLTSLREEICKFQSKS